MCHCFSAVWLCWTTHSVRCLALYTEHDWQTKQTQRHYPCCPATQPHYWAQKKKQSEHLHEQWPDYIVLWYDDNMYTNTIITNQPYLTLPFSCQIYEWRHCLNVKYWREMLHSVIVKVWPGEKEHAAFVVGHLFNYFPFFSYFFFFLLPWQIPSFCIASLLQYLV